MKRYARLLRNGKNMNRRKFIKAGAFLPGGMMVASLPATFAQDIEITGETLLPASNTCPPARAGLTGAYHGAF